jgi:hypothetical protein
MTQGMLAETSTDIICSLSIDCRFFPAFLPLIVFCFRGLFTDAISSSDI